MYRIILLVFIVLVHGLQCVYSWKLVIITIKLYLSHNYKHEEASLSMSGRSN